MMKTSALVLASAVASAALASAGSARAQQVRYRVTDLGVLAGRTSHANAVNGRGQVVGDSTVSDDLSRGTTTVLFENGAVTALPGLGGLYAGAAGINNRGIVVGSAFDPSFYAHAVLWGNGAIVELPTLGGLSSAATDINERGEIVGASSDPSGLNHAVLWSRGEVIDLGSLEGGNTSATAINNRGQVVGSSRMIQSGPFSHAYLWDRGTMTDLDPADPLSVAEAVNDNGVAVGNAGPDPSRVRAAMFRDGQVIQLGTLGGRSYAHAINNFDVVVGESQDIVTRGTHGWIWQNGVFTDLNALLVEGTTCVMGTARDIADDGVIVGNGICNGTVHAVMLTPVTVE